MLLTKQIDTIVKECHKLEVSYLDVMTVIAKFYGGRVPNSQYAIEAIEAIYHIDYDDQQQQEVKTKTQQIISELYP